MLIKKTKNVFEKNRKAQGFSLIELVIYTAGMIVLVSVLILMIVQIYGLYRQITIVPRSDRMGLLTIDRLVKDIRSGQNVELSQSSIGVADGALSIISAENASVINKKFYLQGGRIIYEENGDPNYLSPSDMDITKLQFEYLTTDISEGIRVEIDVNFYNGDHLVTKEYSGFAVLRQSYE